VTSNRRLDLDRDVDGSRNFKRNFAMDRGNYSSFAEATMSFAENSKFSKFQQINVMNILGVIFH